MIADALATIPLFSQCNKRVLARLLPAIREWSVKAGDILFEAGHDANCLFYIQQGEIELYADEKIAKRLTAAQSSSACCIPK